MPVLSKTFTPSKTTLYLVAGLSVASASYFYYCKWAQLNRHTETLGSTTSDTKGLTIYYASLKGHAKVWELHYSVDFHIISSSKFFYRRPLLTICIRSLWVLEWSHALWISKPLNQRTYKLRWPTQNIMCLLHIELTKTDRHYLSIHRGHFIALGWCTDPSWQMTPAKAC